MGEKDTEGLDGCTNGCVKCSDTGAGVAVLCAGLGAEQAWCLSFAI